MKQLLDKIRKVCSRANGHDHMAVRNAQGLGGNWDRHLDSKRRLALEWLGDRHILHRASTFKPTVPAFTVRNLAARRSALE